MKIPKQQKDWRKRLATNRLGLALLQQSAVE